MNFNPADYLDDDNESVDNQTTDNVLTVKYEHHLLITGWSERTIDLDLLEKSFNVTCNNPARSDILKNKDDFYCLDFSLDDEFENKKTGNIELLDVLESILKGCLKHFGNYINVALAYKVEKSDEIQYD